ncbi:MAG: phenylalanine--tRNA ligase subunit beta [Calditrichia bacterium]
MKVSYNWIKDYLDIDKTPQEISDKLSLSGLEVEEYIEKRLDYPQVVVGKVLEKEKHPDADKLSVCKVDVGDETLNIVCGAPNVDAGQTVVVAKIGAELPIGLKIKKAKLRGVESQGMICSEAELQLSDSSDGIWVLPDGLPIGAPLSQALNFENDVIFNIAVTPNRPDCLSHIGVARELSALFNLPLKKPEIQIPESNSDVNSKIKIQIEYQEGCPRYAARYLENVKVGPSPAWLVRRLESVGMRSINNVVDITNYVMLETGHPLHAFDYDQLKDGTIIVRKSTPGEKFVTLDDQERELPENTVMICDAEKPVAIGGIMGGANSEVSSATTRILLESAYFTPENIQLSSRKMGLSTEASQRFERGADPNGVQFALDRAAQLMAELCGAKVYKGAVDAYPQKIEPWTIPFNTEFINRLLGTEMSPAEMAAILRKIELTVNGDQVVIPTFRPDLQRVADLAEEVARLYGLDNIEGKEFSTIPYHVERNQLDSFVDELKDILVNGGLQEVLTPSMVNREEWEKMTAQPVFPILNPISRDMDGMRNSLIPSLAQVLKFNQNRQNHLVRIFEINRVFYPAATIEEFPEERLKLGILLAGPLEGELWYSRRQVADFYDIKGIVEWLSDKISLDNWRFIYYPDSSEKQDSITLEIAGSKAGTIGRLDSKVSDALEIEGDAFVAELDIQSLFENRRSQKQYQPVSRFPFIERDLALLVDDDVAAQKILDLVRQNGGKHLVYADIFDVYRGKQIESGKKSVAVRMRFQSREKTLTEEEIGNALNKVLKACEKQLNAKLRD